MPNQKVRKTRTGTAWAGEAVPRITAGSGLDIVDLPAPSSFGNAGGKSGDKAWEADSPQPSITDEEFGRFCRLIHDKAGIALSSGKKVMVAGRLHRRLSHYGLRRFSDYYRLITGGTHPREMQVMIDLLTTNETYFFREPAHFAFLRDEILPAVKADPLRVWSAACSSGEEVYTSAMILAEYRRGTAWSILGSDVSKRMLVRSSRGLYPVYRVEGIPKEYLRKYCLKGVRSHAGELLIDEALKRHVSFEQINLTRPLPSIGRFHVIFLRNVLIYFNQETKRQVVHRVANVLERGGYFFTSHSESLHGITSDLKMVKPSIYRKR